MSDSLVSPFSAGFRCVCPRCGEGDLFAGYLKVAPRCESCGLDLAFADSGDGPAVFVIFAVAQMRSDHQRGNVYLYVMWILFALAVISYRLAKESNTETAVRHAAPSLSPARSF